MKTEKGRTGRILNLRNLLSEMTAEDIVTAAKVFEANGGTADSFRDSSKYEVKIGDKVYPPKAIFGLAASKRLGQEVRSKHFTGGESSTSFQILRELGFEIVRKALRPGQSNGLELYSSYSREDAQKILGPEDTFTKGSGTWGIQGIVRDRPAAGDAVFFVTLGTHDGNNYEDALTEDGALIWKSQNKYASSSSVIQTLINHDADQNMIYLFLRARGGEKYIFLGPLAFEDWDPLSEKPVHMVWRLLSGPIPSNIVSELNINLRPPLSAFTKVATTPKPDATLTETAPPVARKKTRGVGAKEKKNMPVVWNGNDERNNQLGLAGEKLVLRTEIQELEDAGRPELARRVEHTALLDSAAGYDITSFNPENGEKRFIEVKTTTRGRSSPFFISANEVATSEEYGESYFVYRLYDYRPERGAKFYRVNGFIADHFDLEPTTFQAKSKA